jgi:uncharacterized membrane protein YhaH (DUF805 family)
MISVVMDVLAKSFDFSGRATRKEFWVFTLAMAVVLAAIVGIEINAGIFAQEGPVGPFSCLFMLLLMFPSTAVMVRRFHDVGMSGWWCLMGVVPFLGHFMQFVFMVSEGTYGPNEYGEDPLSRGADVERFNHQP